MWVLALLAVLLGVSIGFLMGVFFVSSVRGPVEDGRKPWHEFEDLGDF